MIAEGNETSGGESGSAGEGRARRSEGDLLAERRARRAAESGEHALTMRAEAAEATVRTLETHVSSLQQRLGEAEEERRRLAERVERTRAAREDEREQSEWQRAAASRGGDPALERELQRASQREYAEQRLRIEAEDRAGEVEREARAEIDRLGRRLDASERDAQALGARLEAAQRELAEAEQGAAAQRAAVLRTEQTLRERLGELERQAVEIHDGLAAERAARERAEQLLAALQQAQRGALLLLGGLADTVARLREAALRGAQGPAFAISQARTAPRAPVVPPSAPVVPSRPSEVGRSSHEPLARAATPPADARGDEMAEALAAAVERLRARVEERPAEQPSPHVEHRAPHKHSMSLIGRTRLALRGRRERRKQRRGG